MRWPSANEEIIVTISVLTANNDAGWENGGEVNRWPLKKAWTGSGENKFEKTTLFCSAAPGFLSRYLSGLYRMYDAI